jgi:hypothetical protein
MDTKQPALALIFGAVLIVCCTWRWASSAEAAPAPNAGKVVVADLAAICT